MDEVLKLLGLIYRAKKLLLGEEVLNQIEKVKIMFIASDTSEKNRIRYEKKCHYYQIKHIDKYDSEQLSNALGKNKIKLIGIIDKGFTELIQKKL